MIVVAALITLLVGFVQTTGTWVFMHTQSIYVKVGQLRSAVLRARHADLVLYALIPSIVCAVRRARHLLRHWPRLPRAPRRCERNEHFPYFSLRKVCPCRLICLID